MKPRLTAMPDRHNARAASWFGWQPSAARRCIRAIGGGHCRRLYDHDCPCQRHTRILDHARRWTDADGQPVLTGEPYEIDGEDLAALVADCRQLGLCLTVTVPSPYYPGHTMLITIRRDPEAAS